MQKYIKYQKIYLILRLLWLQRNLSNDYTPT